VSAVPPREDWPEPEPLGDAGAALTDVILATFRLNGRLMEVAQQRARLGLRLGLGPGGPGRGHAAMSAG